SLLLNRSPRLRRLLLTGSAEPRLLSHRCSSPFEEGRRLSAPAPSSFPVRSLSSADTLATRIRAASRAAAIRAAAGAATCVGNLAISRRGARRITSSRNRRGAEVHKQFVVEEVGRLLKSGAIELCTRPAVISPLSVAEGDTATLLSRNLLSTVGKAQQIGLLSSTPIPLSQAEKEVHPEEQQPSMPSRRHPFGDLPFYGKKAEELMSFHEAVEKSEPSLLPMLKRSIEGARAPNTIRAYKGCMKKLLDFAKERRINPLCPESLLIFSLRRLEEGRSLSSFKILSSSISFFSDPVSPFVSHMLSLFADFARRCSLVSHHKNIPVSHVHVLVHCASLSPRDTNRLRAGLGTALSFGALLRVSELVHLRWDDLTWSKSLLKISIRKAKNDQASEGRETFLSIEEDSESLSLYDAYTQQVPRSEWVFPSLSHPSAHISTDQFRKDLYSLCEVAGIERVTPHQLRVCGVNHSLRSGSSLAEVQRRGRWRSAAGLAHYVRDSVEAQGGTLSLT
ncbi:hypothetical protein PMAYCL1PPCAC_14744, partial [Pristionchus mayeri]